MKNSKPEKHFTSSALIIDDNKILLVHHKKLGTWLYPGGHVENMETPDEALIREVKEETGLDIEIVSEKDGNLADLETDVSVLHNPYTILCELVGDHYHNDIVYLCRISSESNCDLKHSEVESHGIKFFGLDELEDIKLFPNFRRLLLKILSE